MVVAVRTYAGCQDVGVKGLNYGDTVSSGPVSRRAPAPGSPMPGWPPAQEPPPKKEPPKWSIGKLFRRKKKGSGGESSSSEDTSQKSASKRKKSAKTNRRPARTTIEHNITIGNPPDSKRSQSVTKFQHKDYYDEGVLSDPSAGFVGYVGRGLPRSPLNLRTSKESLEKRGQGSSCGSQDGSLRKGRKGRIKARIEAIRNSKHDSSSDDESQRSTSSSIVKFRSDDSLGNYSKDGSVSKRTRSARTDRYIKRLSRDDETQLNREADLIQKGFSRSEAELIALKQRVLSTPSINGESVWSKEDPDYTELHSVQQPAKYEPKRGQSGGYLDPSQKAPGRSVSNASSYNYPAGVINFNAQVNNENITYSVPFNSANKKQEKANVQPEKQVFRRSASVEHNGIYSPTYENESVMVVKFPLGVNPPKKENVAPPLPPPRDPQRKIPTPITATYENGRPVSYGLDHGSQRNSRSRDGQSATPTPAGFNPKGVYENSIPYTNPAILNWSKRPISTSEDHIAMQQNYYNPPPTDYYQNDQPKRPSSVTAEVIRPEVYNRYLARPQLNQLNVTRDPMRRHTQEITNPEFLYFADKTPRSRKPIHIEKSPMNPDQMYMSDSQGSAPQYGVRQRPRNASDFWRKMDTQESQRKNHFGHNRTLSDQSISGSVNRGNYPKPQAPIITNFVKPNVTNGNSGINRLKDNNYRNYQSERIKKDEVDNVPRVIRKEEPICYSNIDIIPMDDIRKAKNSEDDKGRRKSTNLDDALSELEAIYNSLGLGDEDLLDRAEKRELMSPKTTESFPFSSSMKENYSRFPSYSDYADIPVLKRQQQLNRKSSIPDKVHDDMAYRRMNPHERPKSDANSLVSQVSYMLASPALADPSATFLAPAETEAHEPDVILDDVVFRNIRQANNYLKIEDPQPPFGIPIGPVTPAPLSDYLHATPEVKMRSRYIPQDSPDVVADDLAYRTLRKDSKTSNVNEDVDNSMVTNNCDNKSLSQPSKMFDNHVIKKKRAVRSFSANIFSIIQREIDDAISSYNNRAMEKAQSIPDLPEAVVEFGKSGKLPTNFKTMHKLNQLSAELDVPSRPVSKYENEKGESPRDVFFRNERLASRPPLAVTPDKSPKDTTPNSRNARSPRRPTTENFEEALNIMAKEANETSFKLGKALEKLQNDNIASKKEESRDSQYDNKAFINEVNDKLNSTVPMSNNNDKIFERNPEPHVHQTAGAELLPNNYLSKIVFENSGGNDFNDKYNSSAQPRSASKGRSTEDSLMTISNQLKMVGHKIKTNSEMNDSFEDERIKFNALASKYECKNEVPDKKPTADNKISKMYECKYNPVVINESTPFINNHEIKVLPNEGLKKCAMLKKEKPYDSKIEILDNMHSFDDLRKGISDLLDDITHVTDKFNAPKPIQESDRKSDRISNENDGKESPVDILSRDDENEKEKDSRASPEYNSSEELAMIFNFTKEDSAKSSKNKDTAVKVVTKDSHLDLNSPRLVKDANQSFRKMSADETSTSKASAPAPAPEEAPLVPWRINRRQSTSDNASKGSCDDGLGHSKRRSWYRDPNLLMLACSYALVCTQQLAGLDILTLLGIVLAAISIIAMLIL